MAFLVCLLFREFVRFFRAHGMIGVMDVLPKCMIKQCLGHVAT